MKYGSNGKGGKPIFTPGTDPKGIKIVEEAVPGIEISEGMSYGGAYVRRVFNDTDTKKQNSNSKGGKKKNKNLNPNRPLEKGFYKRGSKFVKHEPLDLGGVKDFVGEASFGFNHFRSKLWNDANKALLPNPSLLGNYASMITREYGRIVRKQLDVSARGRFKSNPGFKVKGNSPDQRKLKHKGKAGLNKNTFTTKGVGFATGTLRNSIKVKTKTDVLYAPLYGRVILDFVVDLNMLQYGLTLAKGRRASYIPRRNLIIWLKIKVARGHFNIINKKSLKGQDDSQKEYVYKALAAKISKAASKRNKKPLLKDWYNVSKLGTTAANKKAYKEFMDVLRVKGRPIKAKIRRDVAKQLNKTYGNK